ncbi:MAG TPA: SIS domain-containing protein [Armatimonadota bacterium]
MTPEAYLTGVADALSGIPRDALGQVLRRFEEAQDQGRQVFTLGNGGSAMTASHIVCDFQKSLCGPDGLGLRAMALTDSLSLITAWANDADYTQVFARQVKVLAKPGDLLLAISGSGNSPNVLRAVEQANEMGLVTLGLTGFDGGKLKDLAQTALVVPSHNMQVVEDAHMVVCHLIFTHLLHRPQAASIG